MYGVWDQIRSCLGAQNASVIPIITSKSPVVTSKTRCEKTASFYTCDECGGKRGNRPILCPLISSLYLSLDFYFGSLFTLFGMWIKTLGAWYCPSSLYLQVQVYTIMSGKIPPTGDSSGLGPKSKESLWGIKETGRMLTLIMFWAAHGILMPWDDNPLWQHLGNKALEFSK